MAFSITPEVPRLQLHFRGLLHSIFGSYDTCIWYASRLTPKVRDSYSQHRHILNDEQYHVLPRKNWISSYL